MNVSAWVVPALYWVLIGMWGAILAFYANKLVAPTLKGRFFTFLYIILLIDAFRTLVESMYFGIWNSAEARLLPHFLAELLAQPRYMIAPKLLNLVSAALILLVLLRRWIPYEEEERRRRERAHRQLLESERRYRTLFENMLDAFVLGEIVYDEAGTSVDFRYISVNSAFETMLGVNKEAVIGKTVTEVFPGIEKDRSGWIARFAQVVQTGESTTIEEYSEAIGKWFLVHVYRMETHRFASVFKDITPFKEKERMTGMIEMAGAVCHELRQPMQGVLGFAEIMDLQLADVPGTRDVADKLAKLKTQILRMSHITERLMKITRYATKEHVEGETIIDIEKASETLPPGGG